MAVVKTDIEDLHEESSLDNSADGEYMHLLKEEIHCADDPINSHHYVDPRISNSVTYKIIPMAGDESSTNMQHSPPHDTTFYVISNPGEVFGQHDTAVPAKKQSKREPTQIKAAIAKKRDEKRRATHNEVERRRRDKINQWIMKLAGLVPNSGVADSASKGGILAKACDHITELTEKQKRLEKLEVENEKLVLEVLRLNQELTEMRKETSSMRNQMADNCIVYARHKNQKS